MANPAKQEFFIKDLATTHVILYPSRAHITRTIGDVNLQPGPNQIEIYGLTPTADENSVKIDGTGVNASITDITVDLVPNKESFEDFYPDDSESDDSDSDEDMDDVSDIDDESYPADAKSVKEELETLERRLERVSKIVSTQQESNGYLRTYCSTIATEHVDATGANEVLDLFQRQGLVTFDARQEALQEKKRLEKDIESKHKALARLTKQWKAEKRIKKKKAQKEKDKIQRQKDEKKRQAARLRQERLDFWPKKVYRVVVDIDLPVDTPGSSRRSSIGSMTTLVKEPQPTSNAPDSGQVSEGARSISLLLSYVTSDASWTPRYDVSFSTPTKTGSIVYRAEFRNTTSETWKDSKVSLSTSQASFRGLGDEVPFMHPWNIGLIKSSAASALMNKEEMEYKHKVFAGQQASSVNRAELFGATSSPAASSILGANFNSGKPAEHAKLASKVRRQMAAPVSSGAVQSPHRSKQQGGRVAEELRAAVAPGAAIRHRRVAEAEDQIAYADADEDMGFGLFDNGPTLQQEEATWEDNGLTQTYELPSTRTLAPSFLTRRHKIASLPFKDLILTSISVPKLRPAAFLRARFRNPSGSITLLKGAAGLTLDGTFLGNTSLPRISPGELVTLPLGVDPAIQIAYSKPTSKRSTQGLFSKEAANVYTRNIFITNTKPHPVDLLVLDQVPVSTDEKLRVEILQPKGLTQEGDAVPAGVDAKQTKSKNWGRAKATHKKNGEVAWDVSLEKGSACKLGLEYEIRLPASEGVQSL